MPRSHVQAQRKSYGGITNGQNWQEVQRRRRARHMKHLTGQSILRQTLGRASGEKCLYLENRRGKAPLGLCLDFVGEVA